MTREALSKYDPGHIIAVNLRMLLAREGMDVKDLAPAIGIAQSTLYSHVKREQFSAADVARFALFFGEPVERFYTDPKAGPDGPNGITGRYRRVGVTLPGLDLAAA